jgi:hypothetical protein
MLKLARSSLKDNDNFSRIIIRLGRGDHNEKNREETYKKSEENLHHIVIMTGLTDNNEW